MGKNHAFKLLKTQIETPEGWLRLLREQPLSNLAHVVYCPRCERPKIFGPLPAGEDISRCWVCGEAVLLLDKSFFAALSKFLKHYYRTDRTLVARVKAEFPGWPPLQLEGALSWLNQAWENAPEPRGRPLGTEMYLFYVTTIEALVAPRFVPGVQEDGQLMLRDVAPIMSLTDALDVLRGNYPKDGMTMFTPSGRKRTFGRLDCAILRQIHEEFQKTAVEKFGGVPSLELREVQRLRRWYSRWPDANSRIQGNKVRRKSVGRIN